MSETRSFRAPMGEIMSDSPRTRRLARMRGEAKKPQRQQPLQQSTAAPRPPIMRMSTPHRLVMAFLRTLRIVAVITGAIAGGIYGWKEGKHDVTPVPDVPHPSLIMTAYVAIWLVGSVLTAVLATNTLLAFVTPHQTFRYYIRRPEHAIVINGSESFKALIAGWFVSLVLLIIIGQAYVAVLHYLSSLYHH